MDCDEPHYSDKTSNLHAHRLDHTPSKLPAFRFADLQRAQTLPTTSLTVTPDNHNNNRSLSDTAVQRITTKSQTTSPREQERALANSTETRTTSYPPNSSERRGRRAPASHSSNGIETHTGPPPALSTQHSFPPEAPVRPPNTSTTQWALAQQKLTLGNLQSALLPAAGPEPTKDSTPQRKQTVSAPTTQTRPKIPPIRSFRSSATRTSLGMDSRPYYQYDGADDREDRDQTLRALEGYEDNSRRDTFSREQEYRDQTRNNGGTEDLFLDLALDDLSHGYPQDKPTTTNRRTSRIALPNNRSSLPPLTNSYPMARRGSDLQSVSTSFSSRGNEGTPPSQRTERQGYNTYSHGRAASTPASPLELNKSRYPPSATRTTPVTPRVFNSRDASYDAQSSASGRRPSIPESTAGSQVRGHAYRQSNLSSFSTPRVYNSSPLVGRMAEPEITPEPAAVVESTDDGTVSTTAPSTVWDELDDLKSRIRKLELTGKPPATSGAAVSRATGERPPTATTTATTISTSPKRGRGASQSIVDNSSDAAHAGEAHPLLHAALAKSKTVLTPDLYKALENAASDALGVASMVGSVGQPISSGHSVIGPNGGSIADRQLRRKAESMCRSLTELCIALSDTTSQLGAAAPARPISRGKELQAQVEESEPSPRQLIAPNDSLSRAKQSPSRALSRMEARRSSLLATSALPSPRFNAPDNAIPSPRFNPPENTNTTPTQSSSLAGRRTSIMLRRQRAGTEERETEDGDVQFRAPSRAATEIGYARNSPREYTSQQPLPERAPSTVSNLPARRTYFSNLSPSTTTIPSLSSQRRYLDRSTPERDTSSVAGRLAEERGQRLPVSVTQSMDAGINRRSSLANPGGRVRARSTAVGGAVAQTP
ncbi:hypothetical protein V495_08763 [Pseudogymnoascus sp. VKM F-4514 (FW-929)]|nr:hypothetical protein V495_08763 [Pseudogymnoascus sp. VKM F-4514 (FW-929)]KFY58211.1 hypothetical protein V497_04978 [Pseudogymnoascus sp. VKM F-4516 (FW-969)]